MTGRSSTTPRTASAWPTGVAQVPETFVIAPNGTVVQRFAGRWSPPTLLDEVIARFEEPADGASRAAGWAVS